MMTAGFGAASCLAGTLLRQLGHLWQVLPRQSPPLSSRPHLIDLNSLLRSIFNSLRSTAKWRLAIPQLTTSARSHGVGHATAAGVIALRRIAAAHHAHIAPQAHIASRHVFGWLSGSERSREAIQTTCVAPNQGRVVVQDASATVLRTTKLPKAIENKAQSHCKPSKGSCQPALGHFETSRYHASTVAAGGS